MDTAGKNYLQIIEGKAQDKAVEAVLSYFIDEHKRHAYYQFFRELSDIYDIISPDVFLRPYIDDMETLARFYRIVREAYDAGIPIEKDFSKKTAELVRKHTKSSVIKPRLDVYEINEKTLKIIEGKNISDTEKVFNLLKSIQALVVDQADKSLYLLSIGEKAELIAEHYKERQQNTQETLEALKGVIEEINAARKEQAEKDMPVEVFSIFWVFKRQSISSPEDKANQMRKVLEQYPHWKTSEAHERQIRQGLYKVLLKPGMKDTHEVKELVDKVMRVIKGRVG
jgi:type I restriction enzyme R subunit